MAESQKRDELEQRLRSLNAIFERELRERGFQPDQIENVALPSQLAQLYMEREALQAELDDLAT